MELFENLTRTEYTVSKSGIKIPHSDFDRPANYYDAIRDKTYTGEKYIEMCRFKDSSIALYDRRWQSAKAVIDMIAREIDIEPETCGLCLYGLIQERGEFSSPLVDKMRTWFDKSGDKVKMKRRIAELEAELGALRSAIRGDI